MEIDEEGNAVFTAKDGRTLSTADDVVPEIVAEGVALLTNLPSIPKSAYSTYFQYLPKQTNTKAYTEAFETLFEMGKNAEGMKLATSAAFADAELDELSQGAIYLQGVNTRKSADEVFDDAVIKVKEAASKDGGFSYKEGKYDDSKIKNLRLSKEQKKIAQLAKAFTKFGLNVKFIASTTAEREKGKVGNGAFDPSTSTIILDIFAGENEVVLGSGLLWTISHELTHALKVTAPTEFAALQEYILGEMFDSVEALDRAIMLEKDAHKKHHPDEKPMTRAEAIEEIVARSCENILMDTDAFAKLIADGEQKTPGFAEKIVEVLTNIIDEIVNFFKSLSSEFRSDSEEAEFFDKHAEKYEGLKEKWIAALEKGMENAKVVYGTENDVQREGLMHADRRFSGEFTQKTLDSFGIDDIKDSLQVQKRVFSTLLNEGFFTNKEKRNRIDINAESGIVIETNKSGIDETFTRNNFEKLGKFKKVSKLHTIRLLPEIIQRGQLIADDVNNIHNNGNNKKFAYIEYPLTVDEKNIVVKIAIKKSPQKNKFWVHSIYTTENASSSPASTQKGTEAGHITADNNNIIPQTAEFVKPSEEKKMYSDRSPNRDREILANMLADSKLKQRYYSQKVFLQKYQDEQIRYDNLLIFYN